MNAPKGFVVCSLWLSAVPVLAQGSRAKAEMKVPGATIVIDYGQPSSPTDRVSELKIGQVWRMGKDQATILKTPAELQFGAARIRAGSYSLFLKKTAEHRYELVFNSQTGQWGTEHDPAKDVASIPLEREDLPRLTETFTIELKPTPKGGAFTMIWGKTRLSADFTSVVFGLDTWPKRR
jgi:hypothetical protein